jgi:DNA-binding winged helix-turn-helix (wHTH) protein
MRKRFGKCVFDSGTRELICGRAAVPLSPKALDLLELLLARAPRAVAKDEIQSSIWPETFVTEANLTNLISEIRAAVGDSARRPRFIRTVHRFGYSFQGPVEVDRFDHVASSDHAPLYRIVLGNRKVPLVAGDNILGRHPDAEVRVDHSAVSRQHARISIRAGKAVLEDLQSRNGTFLRDRRLTAPAALRDGDVIRLGPVRMTFRVFSAPTSTEAASAAED